LTFLLGALIVYRIGAHVPVPGIDPVQLAELFKSQQGGILDMFNMFSGGALSRFTIFALGIMPYISASIIMQLLTVGFAAARVSQERGGGGSPQDHAVHPLRNVGARDVSGIRDCRCVGVSARFGHVDPGLLFRLTTVVTLVTGTMFLMWLGEQITERGVGNGISLIIFAGIAAGLPRAIGGTLELTRTGSYSIPVVLFLFVIAILVTALVVFVERGQRKILVNYAKRQVGKKVYGGQSSHLPLKLNMAGVIPPIFASSIILFPATLAGWFGSSENMSWLRDIGATLHPGQPIYVLLYASAIVFFCFFLHGACLQSEGDSGEPEEGRSVRSWHSSG
jgi:preprotein translocase subunit SecY